MDIPDIELIIQWRYISSLCTLFQRLGRAGRGKGTQATGIYLVESQYIDGHKNKVIGKRKRSGKQKDSPKKRQRLDTEGSTGNGLGTSVLAEGSLAEDVSQGSGDLHQDPVGDGETSSTHPNGSSISLLLSTELAPEEYEAIAMDLFINARGRALCCRKVINEYFGNNKQGKYLLESFLDELLRQSVGVKEFHQQTEGMLCCDTCHPDTFKFASPEQPSTVRRRRKVKFNNYTIGSHDDALTTDLENLRERFLAREGLEYDLIFGSQRILSDDMLDRIVKLGCYQKLATLEALVDQTDWRYARKYGQEILDAVHKHYPSPPICTPSQAIIPESELIILAPITDNANLNAAQEVIKRSRAPPKCAACGNTGHIGSWSLNYYYDWEY